MPSVPAPTGDLSGIGQGVADALGLSVMDVALDRGVIVVHDDHGITEDQLRAAVAAHIPTSDRPADRIDDLQDTVDTLVLDTLTGGV